MSAIDALIANLKTSVENVELTEKNKKGVNQTKSIAFYGQPVDDFASTSPPCIVIYPIKNEYKLSYDRRANLAGKLISFEIHLWGRTYTETEVLESMITTFIRTEVKNNYRWGGVDWVLQGLQSWGVLLKMQLTIESVLPKFLPGTQLVTASAFSVDFADTSGDNILGKP